jgi:hypothetical protein
MSRLDARVVRGPLRAVAYLSLLALIALAFAVEGSQPVHTHDASTGAIFNTDCPLAALAAVHGASPLPGSPPAAWIALVATALSVATPEHSPTSPVRHTDSRAPPAPLA